jgi:TRAP-type C4-dicarboxylate transport system permease small subunit
METEQNIAVSGDGAIGILFRVLTVIVAVMMFALMALTFVDVVGRYAFASPVPGAREYIEFIMGTLIFSGFPLLSRDNSHITVSLFDNAFRGRVRRWKEFFIIAVSAGSVGFISVRILDSAMDFHESGLWGEYLDVPIYPVVYGMSGLSFIAFGVLLLLLWAHGKQAISE